MLASRASDLGVDRGLACLRRDPSDDHPNALRLILGVKTLRPYLLPREDVAQGGCND